MGPSTHVSENSSSAVTLNNALDHRTNGLSDYQAIRPTDSERVE